MSLSLPSQCWDYRCGLSQHCYLCVLCTGKLRDSDKFTQKILSCPEYLIPALTEVPTCLGYIIRLSLVGCWLNSMLNWVMLWHVVLKGSVLRQNPVRNPKLSVSGVSSWQPFPERLAFVFPPLRFMVYSSLFHSQLLHAWLVSRHHFLVCHIVPHCPFSLMMPFWPLNFDLALLTPTLFLRELPPPVLIPGAQKVDTLPRVLCDYPPYLAHSRYSLHAVGWAHKQDVLSTA